MKILELKIENVRGIVDFTIKPNGENVIIHGPNGSGKSAVVDAIDFLLTGDMSRLSGRGTRGISLKEHGPHIEHKPKDAIVTAKIKLQGFEKPITIQRKILKPKDLILIQGDPKAFEEIKKLMSNTQNILSRDEILKYIASEAGKRAEEVQAVLNIEEIEDLRKLFVAARKEAQAVVRSNKLGYDTSVSEITALTGLKEFSEETLLGSITVARTILRGESVATLNPDNLQQGITRPAGIQDGKVNADVLNQAIVQIDKFISEKASKICHNEKDLRRVAKIIIEDTQLRMEMANRRLLDLGVSLLGEGTKCPLCFTPWDPEKLKELLDARISKARTGESTQKRIETLSSEIDAEITKLKGHISLLNKCCQSLAEEEAAKALNEWVKKLDKWSQNLKKAGEQYVTTEELEEDTKILMAPKEWAIHRAKIETISKNLEKLTPEEKAWESLTTLKPILKRYLDDKKKYVQSQEVALKAATLETAYTETKDNALDSLYQDVNKDFAEYYKFLHGEDEKTFCSEIKPEGSALGFTVDFYGKGQHHPRALHSEGHQDSMGLCLYLALSKKISADKIKLMVLDDVVMSIDSEHRRNICRLIMKYFPDYQFFITTHNRTWAKQLSTDGVVKKQNSVEFRGWTVTYGPEYKVGSNVWDGVQEKLDKGQIPSAAHQVRNHAEFFYEGVCDALGGKVCYRSDGRYELGDYMPAAKERYKELLRKARISAISWNNKEDIEKYNRMETEANEIIARAQIEQWAINANVHYSKWDDFSKQDFEPIVDAFRDLEGLFICPTCEGLLILNQKDKEPINVSCPCGKTIWNLVKKP